MANYVWTHLFIYKDLEGTLPDDWSESDRLSVGKQIQIPTDAGPTGGNKIFTDSMIPAVQNAPLTLSASYIGDALGLPLTAFNDTRRTGSIRTVTEKDFQPFQASLVKLMDQDGNLPSRGRTEFFGTNPVDIPNCYTCHSGKGVAAESARAEGLTKFDQEYDYWTKNTPDMSEFMKRQAQAPIGILELHDSHWNTEFLKEYNSGASANRLGSVGAVNCNDCHADNVSSRPTARATSG